MLEARLHGTPLLRSALVASGLLLALPIPTDGLAQEAGGREVAPRFAVGAGVLYGTAVCIECEEPGTPGASGGFEARFNESWSIVGEGVWTRGYDRYSFEHEGATYLGLRHDYFAYLELKARWEFSDLRHRPYLLFGGFGSWHKDTYHRYHRMTADRRWVVDVDNPEVREERDNGGGLVVGFGWAFKVGERFEIRPEANLHLGRLGFARVGVSGWFKF